MFRKFFRRMKEDRADSTIISTVIVIPLLFMILITMIDSSAYFANRAQIMNAAQNGARTVSIMGGNGNATQSTVIEKAYGLTKASTCGAVPTLPTTVLAASVKTTASTAIECNMMLGLTNQSGFVNVQITAIKCDPSEATAISQRTTCKISWINKGLPGSALSFINLRYDKDGNQISQVVAGSSESEVARPGLVARR